MENSLSANGARTLDKTESRQIMYLSQKLIQMDHRT